MRFLVTFAVLACSVPAWSASPGPCSNADASAALAKIREYIQPAPDAPEHRWLVIKTDPGWRIEEYSGLRVLIRCHPRSKADELNGVQFGEVEFRYEASRSTMLPKLTSSGLQWGEWSEWKDSLKPLTATEELELPSLMLTMYRLAQAADRRDRHIPFRKYHGQYQLQWEYNQNSIHPHLLAANDVSRFFITADEEATKLRLAEEEAKLRVAEEEAGTQEQEPAEVVRTSMLGSPASMSRPASPDDFYPPGSRRREEEGSPVVQVCVGPNGRLLREPKLIDTSGFPELDVAAIRVAKASRYAAGRDERGNALPEACLKFKVKFSIRQ